MSVASKIQYLKLNQIHHLDGGLQGSLEQEGYDISRGGGSGLSRIYRGRKSLLQAPGSFGARAIKSI